MPEEKVAEKITVYPARRVITMDPELPDATAVAVAGDRIVAVGTIEDLLDAGTVDDTFADAVVCAGLIDQHLHPILGATTLMTEVIAIEDWVLPDRTYPASTSAADYRQRLAAAERRLSDPDEWLFSWGYHRLWHGPLDRAALDAISTRRPVVVWQRSCHEWFPQHGGHRRARADGRGHERPRPGQRDGRLRGRALVGTGMNLLLPALSPVFMSPQRLTAGLQQLVAYLHRNGVTSINEPGIMWDVEPWPLYQQILADEHTRSARRSWSTPAARRMRAWPPPRWWPTPKRRSRGRRRARSGYYLGRSSCSPTGRSSASSCRCGSPTSTTPVSRICATTANG